jgi:hypothetical protein
LGSRRMRGSSSFTSTEASLPTALPPQASAWLASARLWSSTAPRSAWRAGKGRERRSGCDSPSPNRMPRERVHWPGQRAILCGKLPPRHDASEPEGMVRERSRVQSPGCRRPRNHNGRACGRRASSRRQWACRRWGRARQRDARRALLRQQATHAARCVRCRRNGDARTCSRRRNVVPLASLSDDRSAAWAANDDSPV